MPINKRAKRERRKDYLCDSCYNKGWLEDITRFRGYNLCRECLMAEDADTYVEEKLPEGSLAVRQLVVVVERMDYSVSRELWQTGPLGTLMGVLADNYQYTVPPGPYDNFEDFEQLADLCYAPDKDKQIEDLCCSLESNTQASQPEELTDDYNDYQEEEDAYADEEGGEGGETVEG